jgi:uncharacterized protein (TIGR03083 family)
MDLTQPTPPAEVVELLGAFAVDALDDADRRQVEDLIDQHPQLRAEARRLQDAAALLSIGEGEQPAPQLRDGVLVSALASRAPGRHLSNPLGPDLAPSLLFDRQWHELDQLLDELDGADWQAATSFGRSVNELLAHLSASLEQFAHELGTGRFDLEPGVEHHHWGVTEPAIARLVARGPAATSAALRDVAARIGAGLAARTPDAFDAPREGSGISLRDRTRLATFELWIHTDDVRSATGRPMVDPDRERINSLSDLSARFISLGMLLTGHVHDRQCGRLVLTGEGGGTWTFALGGEPGDGTGEAVTIVADAVDYCRVVGKLRPLESLTLHLDGDAGLALDVLEGARTFAE